MVRWCLRRYLNNEEGDTMINRLKLTTSLILMMFLAGCATMPPGPSVMAMPGSGKSFEQSEQQIGKSPQETANQNAAAGAAIGTVAGATLGAIIGSTAGHAGTGAAIGAGSGLLLGTASGANAGQVSAREAQRRYDIAYQQCMYANGNLVPGVRTYYRVQRIPPPPPPGSMGSAPSDFSEPHLAPPPPVQ
jgi:hypothetical protein